MNRARAVADLAVPPGNRLEALPGNRAGFHSIRINDQWRIVFRWTVSGPAEVAIVHDHRQRPLRHTLRLMSLDITPGEVLLEE